MATHLFGVEETPDSTSGESTVTFFLLKKKKIDSKKRKPPLVRKDEQPIAKHASFPK